MMRRFCISISVQQVRSARDSEKFEHSIPVRIQKEYGVRTRELQ